MPSEVNRGSVSAPTAGALLVECLRAAGATRTFGDPVAGVTDGALPHITVGEPHLAALLAAATGRIGAGPGVAVRVASGGGVSLLLSSAPGAEAATHVVSTVAELPLAVAAWSAGRVHAAAEISLEVDLAEPPPPDLVPVALAPSGPAPVLAAELRERHLVVLAGPGVIRAGAVEELRRFAHHSGIGVVNSWGAKGVFAWDDPAHHGTAGLQARDFELAGVLDADLVLAIGVDEEETPRQRWAGPAVLEVEPAHLPILAARWEAAGALPPRPALYTRLAAALAPLYAADAPANPAQLAAGLAEHLPAGGLVAADPGPIGFWIARCFPTRVPGSVVVPARPCPGVAASLAVAGALAGRAATAVIADPVDSLSDAVLTLGAGLGANPAVVQVAPESGDRVLPEPDRLRGAMVGRAQRLSCRLDVADRAVLEDVAGPVVAW